MTEQANSGGFLYLLLLNPVATFYVMINRQAGDNQVTGSLSPLVRPASGEFHHELLGGHKHHHPAGTVCDLLADRHSRHQSGQRKPVKQQKVKA